MSTGNCIAFVLALHSDFIQRQQNEGQEPTCLCLCLPLHCSSLAFQCLCPDRCCAAGWGDVGGESDLGCGYGCGCVCPPQAWIWVGTHTCCELHPAGEVTSVSEIYHTVTSYGGAFVVRVLSPDCGGACMLFSLKGLFKHGC